MKTYLSIIRPDGLPHHYLCRCVCGNTLTVSFEDFRTGKVTSCGCKNPSPFSPQTLQAYKQFAPGTKQLYKIWRRLVQNIRKKALANGYMPGEKIYPPWLEYVIFAHWGIDNGYRDGMHLSPVPIGASYCPLNCRWVIESRGRPRGVQNRAKSVIINGVEFNVQALARTCGLTYPVLYQRLRTGWSLLDAMTIRKRRKNLKLKGELS